MNQIQSLEEQLIQQEWERLMVELRKASEIVKGALRRYEGLHGGRSLSIGEMTKALHEVACSTVYEYIGTVKIAETCALPSSIPDTIRPLLLSVASRELLERLREVPVLIDQVSDLESRQP